METWLLVCLALAVLLVSLSKNSIYFEAFSISVLTGLIVFAVEPLTKNLPISAFPVSGHTAFIVIVPVVFFFLSFFRYLPTEIFLHPWPMMIFTVTYDSVILLAGVVGDRLTALLVIVSILVGIVVLMGCASALIISNQVLVSALKNYSDKEWEQGIAGTDGYKQH